MNLPVYYPTRIVNILFGTSYIVVVPFVYFCIFRSVMNIISIYGDADVVTMMKFKSQGETRILLSSRVRHDQDQRVSAAVSKAVLQRRRKRNLVRMINWSWQLGWRWLKQQLMMIIFLSYLIALLGWHNMQHGSLACWGEENAGSLCVTVKMPKKFYFKFGIQI